MPTKKRNARPAAADQFAALGLDPEEWTPAMKVAVSQKWTGLETDAKVSELQQRLDDHVRPTMDDVLKDHPGVDDAEAARLLRNRKVDSWRVRTRLQAALDARRLRFTKMRAARSKGSSVA